MQQVHYISSQDQMCRKQYLSIASTSGKQKKRLPNWLRLCQSPPKTFANRKTIIFRLMS